MLLLEAISAAIGGALVLRGIALEVARGSCVALIGRNGAGKTSTLRAIMGLLPLQRGRIVLGGKDLGAVPP
jgi:ABC-type branched-subunit amino acid transport system ATPase component